MMEEGIQNWDALTGCETSWGRADNLRSGLQGVSTHLQQMNAPLQIFPCCMSNLGPNTHVSSFRCPSLRPPPVAHLQMSKCWYRYMFSMDFQAFWNTGCDGSRGRRPYWNMNGLWHMAGTLTLPMQRVDGNSSWSRWVQLQSDVPLFYQHCDNTSLPSLDQTSESISKSKKKCLTIVMITIAYWMAHCCIIISSRALTHRSSQLSITEAHNSSASGFNTSILIPGEKHSTVQLRGYERHSLETEQCS